MPDLRELIARAIGETLFGYYDAAELVALHSSCTQAMKAAAATLAAIEANGYAIVPVEPTGEMVAAVSAKPSTQTLAVAFYRTMLAARPDTTKAPASTEADRGQ